MPRGWTNATCSPKRPGFGSASISSAPARSSSARDERRSETSKATWCMPGPRFARKRPTGVSSPSEALEAATSEKQTEISALLEKAGAKLPPVATLTDAQLARCAGSYSDGRTTLAFAAKDGKLTGGLPGQSATYVARNETTFALAGRPGFSLVFAAGGDRAESVTVNQGGAPGVYKRVEGK